MADVIAEIVTEAFTGTALTKSDETKLFTSIVSYYKKFALFFPTELEANNHIYGNRLKENHSVYRAKGSCFVIPSRLNPADVAKPVTATIAKKYVNQPQTIPAHILPVTETVNKVREVFASYRLSKRKFTVEGNDSPVFPSEFILQKFYECGRKAVYSTQHTAVQHVETGNNAYQCKWCGNWHQGRQPTGEFVPHDMRVHRWEQAWRRHNHV